MRHVEAEEAEALLGFRPRGGGVWIPYFSQEGGPLMVDGREYGRLRLDKPSARRKILSRKESGAQLYVPELRVVWRGSLLFVRASSRRWHFVRRGSRQWQSGAFRLRCPGAKFCRT